MACDDAERIYVGKAASCHTLSQDEINTLIAKHALAGKTVCRLKGGDPFVFGRGGEEAAYLRERGIPFVIVPGISSAIGGPAYAGIPVTDRSCASSFAVITGHEDPNKPESALDWESIAHGADTLIFLMGLANLPEIASKLIDHGRSPETPVAAIQSATTPSQRVVVGTLADIASKVLEAGLESPVLTVVGDVVSLRSKLAWFDNRPLFGKRILVTRAREQASELSRLLREAGDEPIEVPVIRIEQVPPAENLILRLQSADWIVFTSANGLPCLLNQLNTLGTDIRVLGKAKLAAIGPATAASLQERNLRVDFIPSKFVAESVAEEFPDPIGRRILIARAEEAREVLPEMLRKRGAEVDEIAVYRTVMENGELPDLSTIDAITFTSSSTVRNFRVRYPDEITGPVIACIGPITAQTAREAGLQVHVEPKQYTIPALVEALNEYFRH